MTDQVLVVKTGVTGVYFLQLPEKVDARGNLCPCSIGLGKIIPFDPKNSFWIYNTPKGAARGFHAHKESRQAHICIHGSAKVTVDDGRSHKTIVLNKPNKILLIEPMVWHFFSLKKGSKFLVLSSKDYGEEDYIRNYKQFKEMTA